MSGRMIVWLSAAMLFAAGCGNVNYRDKYERYLAEGHKTPPSTAEEVKLQRAAYVDAVQRESPLKDVKWDVAINGHRISRVTLRGDHLYVETRDYWLYAVEAGTGITKWALDVTRPLQFPPTVVHGLDDQLAAGKASIENIKQKLEAAKQAGDREASGKLESDLKDAKNRLVTLQDKDAVYFMSQDVLWCLDRRHGVVLWKKPLAYPPSTPAFATADYIFVGTWDRKRVWAINAKTKDESVFWRVWSPTVTTPVYAEPSLYFAAEDGKIHSVDLEGKANWSYTTERGIRGDIKIADRLLLAPSLDFALYGIDRYAGVLSWKFESGSPISQQPQISGDTVFVKSDRIGLFALDLKTGQKKWMLPGGERFLVRSKRLVYVLGPGHEIVGIDEKTGDIRARWNANLFPILVTNEATPVLYLATPDGHLIAASESNEKY